MPVTEHVYGRYPWGQFLAGAFAIFAGGIFMMVGLDMDGTARLGITGMGLLAILMGLWQVVAGIALRRASIQRRDNGGAAQR